MENLSCKDDWSLPSDRIFLSRKDPIAENLQVSADGLVKTNVSRAELRCPANAQQSIALGEASLRKSYSGPWLVSANLVKSRFNH